MYVIFIIIIIIIKSCKVYPEVWSTLGQTSDPSLVWKKVTF